MLDDLQIERYSRQILLPGVGGTGQERLLSARVKIFGEGRAADRLGAYLEAAGVGHLDGTIGSTARNPDVSWGPLGEVDLCVGVGDLPEPLPEAPVVWAASAEDRIVCVRALEPPVCLICLESALASVRRSVDDLAGTVAATAALSHLLGIFPPGTNDALEIDRKTGASTRIDLDHSTHDAARCNNPTPRP